MSSLSDYLKEIEEEKKKKPSQIARQENKELQETKVDTVVRKTEESTSKSNLGQFLNEVKNREDTSFQQSEKPVEKVQEKEVVETEESQEDDRSFLKKAGDFLKDLKSRITDPENKQRINEAISAASDEFARKDAEAASFLRNRELAQEKPSYGQILNYSTVPFLEKAKIDTESKIEELVQKQNKSKIDNVRIKNLSQKLSDIDGLLNLPASELPKRQGEISRLYAERLTANIATDFVGTTASLIQGFSWASSKLGKEDAAKGLNIASKRVSSWSDAIRPENQDFADKVQGALGSQLAFFVPSLGVSKAASFFGKVSPKLANIFGGSTMAALESTAEAGDVYETLLSEGKTKEEADNAATNTFWANVALNIVTERFGLFSEGAGVARVVKVSVDESVQEMGQQVISNVNTGRPYSEGVLESGAIAVITGGIGGSVTGGKVEPNIDVLVDPVLEKKVDEQVESGETEVDLNSLKSGLPEDFVKKINRKTDKIVELEEAIKRGDKLPPIPVFKEGDKFVTNKDGDNRLIAYQNVGVDTVPVRIEAKTELTGTQKQAEERAKAGDIPAELSSLSKKAAKFQSAEDFASTEGTGKERQIGVLKANEIIPRDNVDKNTNEYKSLVSDIKKNGIKEPVIVQVKEDGSIETTEGSHRVVAALETGANVPVIVTKGEIPGGISIEEFFNKSKGSSPTTVGQQDVRTPKEPFKQGIKRDFSFDPDSTKNEGRFNLRPASKYKSFFREKLSTDGVSTVVGLTADGAREVQALRFDKNKFTEEQAREWFDKNKDSVSFESDAEKTKEDKKPVKKKKVKPKLKKEQPAVTEDAPPLKEKIESIPPGFKKSRVIERVEDTLRSEVDLNETLYKTITLKGASEKAIDIVNKQPDLARDIISGNALVPEGTTKAAVLIAAAEQARKSGDFKTQKDLIIQRSFMQTRNGQEIVTEKLVNSLSSDQFIKQVLKVRMDKVIKKVAKGKNKAREFADKVKKRAESANKKVNNQVLSKIESAQKIIDDLIC